MVPKESVRIPLKQENIDFVKNAMVGVTKEGTSARSFAGAAYESGGKTGTAQAAAMSKSVKYEASKIAERLRDHSLYIAFAPADKPRIALAIIVENAGFGAAAAAPIARQAIDYYLLGKRPVEPEPVLAKGAAKPDLKAAVKTVNTVTNPAPSPAPNPAPAPAPKPAPAIAPPPVSAGKVPEPAARSTK